MFRVADHDYDIASASLELFSSTREDIIFWGVRIIAKSLARSDEMSKWNPSIIADELFQTTPGQMTSWQDIVGTTIHWREPNEDPQAMFEVFETAAIYDCTCQFTPGNAGRGVQLVLEGMVDVDTDYRALPIRVETQLTAGPWPWGKMSEAECRREYQRLGFKDPVDFQVLNGVSSLVFLNQ